jgi:hypothetical protein
MPKNVLKSNHKAGSPGTPPCLLLIQPTTARLRFAVRPALAYVHRRSSAGCSTYGASARDESQSHAFSAGHSTAYCALSHREASL